MKIKQRLYTETKPKITQIKTTPTHSLLTLRLPLQIRKFYPKRDKKEMSNRGGQAGGKRHAGSAYKSRYSENERNENRRHQRKRRMNRNARAGFDFFHSNLAPSERFILSRKNRASRLAKKHSRQRCVECLMFCVYFMFTVN